jgi:Arc/MetJ-type ribon-helix-helix transcriptional regulator
MSMDTFSFRMDAEMRDAIDEKLENDHRYGSSAEIVRECIRVTILSEYGESD